MAPTLIFITGSTGFIGSRVLDFTLQAGHRVRLSVRREAQIQDLKDLFPKYVDNMDFVVVPDITKPDAFAGKLESVDCVFHIASPMPSVGTDFKKDFAEPAVAGTESFLRAAAEVQSVKRVVVMASIASIMPLDGLNRPELVTKGTIQSPFLRIISMVATRD